MNRAALEAVRDRAQFDRDAYRPMTSEQPVSQWTAGQVFAAARWHESLNLVSLLDALLARESPRLIPYARAEHIPGLVSGEVLGAEPGVMDGIGRATTGVVAALARPCRCTWGAGGPRVSRGAAGAGGGVGELVGMTDADLARWEAQCRPGGGLEWDDAVRLILEVRRLRAVVMGPPTTKYCPKCGVRNSAFVETTTS